MILRWSVLTSFLAALLLSQSVTWAAGKKRPEPPQNQALKRGIQLNPIMDRFIELPDPDEPVRYYGRNIYERLTKDLVQTHQYAVLVGPSPEVLDSNGLALAMNALDAPDAAIPPDPCIIDTPALASSEISIRVNELSFQTGSRGERTYYGFRPGFENAYNAGVDENKRNEFPFRKDSSDPTWFENAFADTGDLHTGLELGHEFNFDLLLVGAKIKHMEYFATMGLDVAFQNHLGGHSHQILNAKGQGFYFDLSAHFTYQGGDFRAGVMAARKAAMLDAFNHAIDTAVKAISSEVAKLPLVARLAARCQGALYVAGGANFKVPVGQRFYDFTTLLSGRKPAVFTVEEIFQKSARLKVEGEGFALGDELVSLAPGESVPAPKPELAMSRLSSASDLEAAKTDLNTANENLDIPHALEQFIEGFLTRLIEGIKALFTLPYRIYRFFSYDQDYFGGELWDVDAKRATALAQKSWGARAIGLPQVFSQGPVRNQLGARNIIVGIIDSGVDYNHRELRRNIYWDGVDNTPGFDFFSGDARPYDDHAHGTEIASLIGGGGAELVGVAPQTTLLPIKAFGPFGITNSASLYQSFVYAISKGARILVLGWATKVPSNALKEAIQLAAANGVFVVAAAGDGGVDLERTPYYPAAFGLDNMIVVGGYGQDGTLTREKGAQSNYGRLVDIAAPGEFIRVAHPRDHYLERTHTGLAAAYVAGAAALLWARCPGARYDAIKRMILEGSQKQDAFRDEIVENRGLFLPTAVDKMNQICK